MQARHQRLHSDRRFPELPGAGASGIYLSGAVATLSRSSVFGANNPFGPGGNGIDVQSGSFVRVAGVATNVVQSGLGPNGPAYAILADATSSAVVHGGVTLTSSGGVSGAVTVGAVELPYLSISGTTTPSGELSGSQLITLSFAGVIPSTWLLLGADFAPSFSTSLAPLAIGEILIPYPPAIVMQDNLNAVGAMQFTMIPANAAPWSLAIPLYFQFGVYDTTAGQFRLSNGDVRVFQ